MALSDDQRAMLRLLAQREQGYEDMAALMGVSVEELRGRVKDALAQLEREGETPPPLPDSPAAEAVPRRARPEPPAAEAPPPPEASPEPPELSATPPSGAVPPSLPPDDPRAAGAGDRGGSDRRGGRAASGFSLSSNGARVALAAIAGAVVIVVVLVLVLGGGSSDSDSTSTSAETSASSNASAPTGGGSAVSEAERAAAGGGGGKEVTKAILTASGGGSGRGVAIFGRVQSKLALQIVVEGLEPLADGESYAIWIAQSPRKMLPLAAAPVTAEGTIASQFEVPTELLGYLANETFDEIAVTRASNSKLNAALKEATKEKQVPAYTGTEVLRGKITGPIIGAAQRLEEEEGSKGK